MPGSTVLILVRDILGAGLLGALAEVCEREPVFPFAGERGETAVARLTPAVVLAEAHHPAARTDAFYDAARAAGSRVILFSPSPAWDDVREIARRQQVAELIQPEPGESLARLLERALRG